MGGMGDWGENVFELSLWPMYIWRGAAARTGRFNTFCGPIFGGGGGKMD